MLFPTIAITCRCELRTDCRIERQAWDGTTAATERYALDGGDPAKPDPLGNVAKDAATVLDGSNAVVSRWAFGTGFAEAVARQTAGGAVSWDLADRQGSVRVVVDNSASVLGTAAYDGYGNLTAGALYDGFGYAGQKRDTLTGLDGSGHGMREYDPGTGRFFQRDPIWTQTGDPNPFTYTRNSPTNLTDPSGLKPPPRPAPPPPPRIGPGQQAPGGTYPVGSGTIPPRILHPHDFNSYSDYQNYYNPIAPNGRPALDSNYESDGLGVANRWMMHKGRLLKLYGEQKADLHALLLVSSLLPDAKLDAKPFATQYQHKLPDGVALGLTPKDYGFMSIMLMDCAVIEDGWGKLRRDPRYKAAEEYVRNLFIEHSELLMLASALNMPARDIVTFNDQFAALTDAREAKKFLDSFHQKLSGMAKYSQTEKALEDYLGRPLQARSVKDLQKEIEREEKNLARRRKEIAEETEKSGPRTGAAAAGRDWVLEHPELGPWEGETWIDVLERAARAGNKDAESLLRGIEQEVSVHGVAGMSEGGGPPVRAA